MEFFNFSVDTVYIYIGQQWLIGDIAGADINNPLPTNLVRHSSTFFFIDTFHLIWHFMGLPAGGQTTVNRPNV